MGSPSESVSWSAIAALIISIGLFSRDIHPFFRKPDLSIEFDGNVPNSYTPNLQIVNPDGSRTGITRHFLKVRVKNTG
jgi:hypothetical protein